MKKLNGFLKRVLLVITVILIVGAILDAFYKWRDKNLSDAEKLNRLLKERERYNEGVNKAFVNEKWIYLTARTLIALSLLILNLYWYYFVENQKLDAVLDIDKVILLIYSFIAFAVAGTPSKFVKLLRTTIVNLRKRWHVGKIDIVKINKDIEELELKIKKVDSNVIPL